MTDKTEGASYDSFPLLPPVGGAFLVINFSYLTNKLALFNEGYSAK